VFLTSFGEKLLHGVLRPIAVGGKDFGEALFDPLPFFFICVLQDRFTRARRKVYAAERNVRDLGSQQSLKPLTSRFRPGCAMSQTLAQSFGEIVNEDGDIAVFIHRRDHLVIAFDRFIQQRVVDGTGIDKIAASDKARGSFSERLQVSFDAA
jgi:hypothetical protein